MSHENLSAMLDGECSDEEIMLLLGSTEDSAALTDKWSRLCLARDLIGGKPVTVKAPLNFCAGVMARLDEPASSPVVVPFPVQSKPQRSADIVVAPSRRQSRFRRDFARPLIGLAAAASLAFVAVAAGRSFFGHVDAGQQQSIAAVNPSAQQVAVSAQSSGARGGLVQVSNRVASAEEPAELGWSQLDADSARELNEYLAQHNSYGASQGLGGSLGSARMAALRTADYRSAADGSR